LTLRSCKLRNKKVTKTKRDSSIVRVDNPQTNIYRSIRVRLFFGDGQYRLWDYNFKADII
jgi:hypothetical protein